MKTLGIIAGGGALPRAVAQSAQDAGKKVFVVALTSAADEGIGRFPHVWASLGEAGKVLRLLHEHECGDVLLAGLVEAQGDDRLDDRGDDRTSIYGLDPA